MKIAAILLIFLGHLSIQSGIAQPCPTSSPVEARPWQGPKLIEAVLSSDANAARDLIAKGVPLDERDNQGNTALVAALTPRANLEPPGIVSKENREREVKREFIAQSTIVSLLLEHGADPNAPGAQGRTPIMQVSEWGHSPNWDRRIAETLLSHGAQVGRGDSFGNTALILASEHRKTDLVRLLAEHGANPTEKNCHGASAISIARTKNFTDVLQLLERAVMVKPK